MKNADQIVVLLSTLVCLGLSAPAYGNPQSAHEDLSGNLPSVSKPGHPISPPRPETKYSMKIITPSLDIDYEIVSVTPDPSVNFTIRNVGPELGNPFMRGDNRYEGSARKNCHRK